VVSGWTDVAHVSITSVVGVTFAVGDRSKSDLLGLDVRGDAAYSVIVAWGMPSEQKGSHVLHGRRRVQLIDAISITQLAHGRASGLARPTQKVPT
jgi:hypothetical protein